MVEDAQRHPTAGARLLRSLLQGPQDLTITESANPLSQGMWERLGGRAFPAYSMEWVRILRPAAFAIAVMRERMVAARTLWPLALRPAGPGSSSHGPTAARDEESSEPIRDVVADEAAMAAAVAQLAEGYRLRPRWDPAVVAWKLQHAAAKEQEGPLQKRLVYRRGVLIGAYLLYGRPRRIAYALQAFAARGHADAVVDSMFRIAAAQGYAGVRGCTQPDLTDVLLRRRCVFVHRAAFVAHAKRPDLLQSIRAEDGLLTGLAAETWTRLIGGEFT
jgi:hypothetical protein